MNDQQSIEHIVKETCGACMGSDASEGWRCNICGYKKAIEALEKQIPKKPLNVSTQIDHQQDAKQNVGECPNCKNNIVAYAWCNNTHCWVCGQAIDWSVEE